MLMESRFATIKPLQNRSMIFFCNIGKNLSDKLPQTENRLPESRFSVNEHTLWFEFQAVNSAQVAKVFGKFKKSLGVGTDGIANHFLKIAFPVIGESLCNIFNLSLATGVFPNCWKIALVPPFLKVVNLMIDQIIDRFQCSPSCPGYLKNWFLTSYMSI